MDKNEQTKKNDNHLKFKENYDENTLLDSREARLSMVGRNILKNIKKNDSE